MHSVTDRQTDGQQAAANSRSYCVVVRSAKNQRRTGSTSLVYKYKNICCYLRYWYICNCVYVKQSRRTYPAVDWLRHAWSESAWDGVYQAPARRSHRFWYNQSSVSMLHTDDSTPFCLLILSSRCLHSLSSAREQTHDNQNIETKSFKLS